MPRSLSDLLKLVHESITSDSSLGHAFVYAVRDDTLTLGSAQPYQRLLGWPPTPNESLVLQEFSSMTLPILQISSPLRIRPREKPAVVEINSDLALFATNDVVDPHSASAAQFAVIVSIVHQIAHILRTVVRRHSGRTTPPSIDEDERHSEADLLVETAIFGGIIGIILRDEGPREQLPFQNLDFRRVDYLFLLVGDQTAYRLDISDIDTWFAKNSLAPFDVDRLKVLDPLPTAPRLRACAWLNDIEYPKQKTIIRQPYLSARSTPDRSTPDPDEFSRGCGIRDE